MDDFTARAESIGWPDHEAERAARDRAGRLGTLDLLTEWLAGVQGCYPPLELTRPRLVVFAADHGVAEAGISRHQPGHAELVAARIRDEGTPLTELAELTGVAVRVLQFASSERIDRGDAVSPEVVSAAVAAGIGAADTEIDAGADLLIIGGVGAGATTAAAVLVSVLSGAEPVKTVGRGSGIDDAAWMRKASAVRDARRRAWPHRLDALELLRVAGGADVAAMAGFAFEAAARRTPVLLDGVVAAAAAMVAATVQPRVSRWWRAAQLTPEPAHARALAQLGLSAVLDLGISAGDGTGGLLVLPMLRAAIRLRTSPDV